MEHSAAAEVPPGPDASAHISIPGLPLTIRCPPQNVKNLSEMSHGRNYRLWTAPALRGELLTTLLLQFGPVGLSHPTSRYLTSALFVSCGSLAHGERDSSIKVTPTRPGIRCRGRSEFFAPVFAVVEPVGPHFFFCSAFFSVPSAKCSLTRSYLSIGPAFWENDTGLKTVTRLLVPGRLVSTFYLFFFFARPLPVRFRHRCGDFIRCPCLFFFPHYDSPGAERTKLDK